MKKNEQRPQTRQKATASGESRVRSLRRRFGLPQEKFNRVLGVSTRTLAELERGKPPTEPVARRVTEAERLHRALGKVVRPDAIGKWMEQPNTAFGGLKPLEVIERGHVDQLWAMIFDLRSGNPA